MTKLTDIQLILLTTAAGRDDGSLLPPPASIGDQGDRIRKAVTALLKRGLAQEAETTNSDANWREDGDLRIGVVITEAGREAIGASAPEDRKVEVKEEEELLVRPEDGPAKTESPPSTQPSAPKAGSKQAIIIDLLKRDAGASLDELVQATNWLPHTTRAALTGLRKRGHVLHKAKVDGTTRYSIASA